jgi:hypothetical protein
MTAPENPTSNVEQAIGEVLRDAIRAVVDRIERDGIHNEAPGSAAWCHDYTEAIYEQVAAVVAGVRAEALRWAAHEFPGPHSREEINNARDARRWLRRRADDIERADRETP